MAYDLFTLSTMSFKYECNFNKISYTIAAQRSNLNGENI